MSDEKSPAAVEAAEDIRSLAPSPAGVRASRDDDDDEPSIPEELDSLIARIKGAQNRIKGKADLFIQKAGGATKLSVAVRDTLSDDVLQLIKELAELVADGAEGFDKLVHDVDELDYQHGKLERTLKDWVSGSAIAYALMLSQAVLTRPTVDDEMRRLAQEIMDSMSAVQAMGAPQQAPAAPAADGAAPVAATPPGVTPAPDAAAPVTPAPDAAATAGAAQPGDVQQSSP